MLMVKNLWFFLSVLKEVDGAVVVTTSMIHMQNLCVPDVVKNLMLEHLI